MSADHQVNSDMRELAKLLARENAGQMTIALHELLNQLAEARNTRDVPAVLWYPNARVLQPSDGGNTGGWERIISANRARRRVVLVNGNAADPIYLAPALPSAGAPTTATELDTAGVLRLRAGEQRELFTTGEVFAKAISANALLSWHTEDYDYS